MISLADYTHSRNSRARSRFTLVAKCIARAGEMRCTRLHSGTRGRVAWRVRKRRIVAVAARRSVGVRCKSSPRVIYYAVSLSGARTCTSRKKEREREREKSGEAENSVRNERDDVTCERVHAGGRKREMESWKRRAKAREGEGEVAQTSGCIKCAYRLPAPEKVEAHRAKTLRGKKLPCGPHTSSS